MQSYSFYVKSPNIIFIFKHGCYFFHRMFILYLSFFCILISCHPTSPVIALTGVLITDYDYSSIFRRFIFVI